MNNRDYKYERAAVLPVGSVDPELGQVYEELYVFNAKKKSMAKRNVIAAVFGVIFVLLLLVASIEIFGRDWGDDDVPVLSKDKTPSPNLDDNIHGERANHDVRIEDYISIPHSNAEADPDYRFASEPGDPDKIPNPSKNH
eukprot:Nk52_evm61s914 gene=Nk52_evmTU61s914